MWHGRRTDFPFLDFLFEVIHGNVCPHITAEVNENIVDTFHSIKLCSQVIIVFDLCRELLALQPEMSFNEFVSQFNPVYLRKGDKVRIEITSRSAEFR